MAELTSEDLGDALAAGRLLLTVTDRNKRGFEDWATIQSALGWALEHLPHRCSTCDGKGSYTVQSSRGNFETDTIVCADCDGSGVAPAATLTVTRHCPHDPQVGPFSCGNAWVCPPELGVHEHSDVTCVDGCPGGLRFRLRPHPCCDDDGSEVLYELVGVDHV